MVCVFFHSISNNIFIELLQIRKVTATDSGVVSLLLGGNRGKTVHREQDILCK